MANMNKVKALNIINKIMLVVSILVFLSLIQKEGIAQVGFLTTAMFVTAMVLSSLAFIMHWKNKRDGIYD